MKLKSCDIKSIYRKGYYMTDNRKILEDFVDSGLDAAEVLNWTQKNYLYASSSLNVSIKHYGIPGIKSVCRKGKVYLVRIDAYNH